MEDALIYTWASCSEELKGVSPRGLVGAMLTRIT